MENTYTIKNAECSIEKINNDKYILNIKTMAIYAEQYVINHRKFRDKAILRTLSKTKLKNLIARCEEILQESEE